MTNILISRVSQSDAQTELQFAILVELDWQSMENFLSFLQYQDNEEQLALLSKWCGSIDFNSLPDKCSAFLFDLTTLVSEKTAQEMAETSISTIFPPQVCYGKFVLPHIKHPITASQLYQKFKRHNIANYFLTPAIKSSHLS